MENSLHLLVHKKKKKKKKLYTATFIFNLDNDKAEEKQVLFGVEYSSLI